MSGFIAEPIRSDDKELALRRSAGDLHIQGQGHDRTLGDIIQEQHPTSRHGSNRDEEIEITASQKMLSAVSGSLFTSLLGMSSISLYTHIFSTIQ